MYDKTIILIGQRFECADFLTLQENLGVPLAKVIENDFAQEWAFYGAGLSLMVDRARGSFSSFFIHIDTELVKSGVFTKWNFDLPYDIKQTDTAVEVKKKLGNSGIANCDFLVGKSPQVRCELQSIALNFHFHQKTDSLISLSCRDQCSLF